jgi:hypothetical protein
MKCARPSHRDTPALALTVAGSLTNLLSKQFVHCVSLGIWLILYILYIVYIHWREDVFKIDYFPSIKYVIFMLSESLKILFVATRDLIDRVDDFRFDNRINSRSEAIRRLLEEALKKYEKKRKK